MQKIFSQQIRFKDENGNTYPDWEEKRLGNQLIEGSKVPVNDTSEYRKITIGLNKSGVRGADLSRKMADTRPFYVRTANEIIIGKQNYFNGSIAIIPETFDGTICSNAIMSFKVNAQNSTKFIYEAISSRDFLKRREALANGTGQKELSESEFMNFKVLLPCIEEQQKIADFLTTLDDKITAEKSKLTATRQFKKALLQRMFA
jgi:type I restriction enzyme S subunit